MVFMRRSGGASEGCDLVLCEECAKSRGIIAGKGSLDLNLDDLIGVGLEPSPSRAKSAVCPSCGLELDGLMREGRLGCSSCADAFSAEIAKSIGRRTMPPRSNARLPGGVSSSLEAELKAALSSEDYEKAAFLRDELSQQQATGSTTAPNPSFPVSFPLAADSFCHTKGVDDDVVLWSSAQVYRDIEGRPFPGSPKESFAPSRSVLLERLLAYGTWGSRAMSELGSSARRSLAERGILSRGYAADDEAVLLSIAEEGCYALLDEGDHLRLRTIRPGFDPASALTSSLAHAERIGRDFPFARRPELGWVCARLRDCGLGAYLSASVHLPALTAEGMRDRLFRALMADGVALRGFYSNGEESSGSVYEIGIEPAACSSARSMVEALAKAEAKVVQAERRARAELAAVSRPALADAEGRAFGLVHHCGFLGADEAASLISTLRLASLRGSLRVVEARELGSVLGSLGTGSVAYARGLRDLPESEAADALRARLVKAALANAEYMDSEEEGA